MNPIYQAWLRSKDAGIRYDFLRKLYGAYDGMLEQAIKDLKKEKKRKCNENKGIIAGIGNILRSLREWVCG